MRTKVNIEKEARMHLDEIGYSQFQLKCIEKQTAHGLEAAILNDTYEVNIEYDPDWRGMFERAKASHLSRKKKSIFKIFRKESRINASEFNETYGTPEDVLKSVTLHEHGHWRYCPYDKNHFEMILDAVSRGLKDAGLDESKIKQKIYRTANEFEDIVDNCSLAIDHKETIKGRSLKYLREVFLDEKKPNLNSSYAVFADIQMKIFNPKADFAKDYCPNYNKEAKPIIDSVLMAFGKELQLGPASIKGELNEKEILELINHLKNPENWSQLAYDYAKLTAHLESNMNLPMTPFFSKLKNDPGFRSQLIQIALQKSHDPSPYMDSFEVFKEKHKMAGKKIRHDIFGSGKDNSSQYSLPYAHLSSGKTDNIAKASLGKTRAKVGGGLQFKKKMIPLVLPPRSKSSEGSLADLLLVCDNSGSMKGYEYSLMIDTVYAIFEGLKQERKAHLLQYGLLQFSSKANQSWSGWCSDIDRLERVFYNTIENDNFGGETSMPVNLLKSADKAGCALVGISDGQIDNSLEAINALLNHNGPLIWIQIGNESDIYNAIKNYSDRNRDKFVVAHKVENINNLPASLLHVTNSLYRRGN